MLLVIRALPRVEWRIQELDGRLGIEDSISIHLSWRWSLNHVFVNDILDLLRVSLVSDISQEVDGFLTPGDIFVCFQVVPNVLVFWLLDEHSLD